MTGEQTGGTVKSDWEAECRWLGYMILNIHGCYLQAREHMGGDSELLHSAVIQAHKYVDGPLRVALDFAQSGRSS